MRTTLCLILLACLGGCNAVPAGSGGAAPAASNEPVDETPNPHPWDGNWRFTSVDGVEMPVTLEESKVVMIGYVDIGITSRTATLSGDRFLLSWDWELTNQKATYSFDGSPQGDGTFWGMMTVNYAQYEDDGVAPSYQNVTESETAMVPIH